MGIRSDIGIALKAAFVPQFELLAKEHLPNFSETFEHELGNAYVLNHVKWYSDNPDVKAITDYLDFIGEDNYLVVEACHDYPESTEGDSGNWTDNPFNIGRNISVSISVSMD